MSTAGLRVDVDTFRGTRDGVPRLLETLARYGITATFFFSVGPDNMGRHVWRLLKPRFLLKMLRSDAASLYGWDILLAGTAWSGKEIGRHLGNIIRETAAAGHEVGLHAWDHHGWQTRVEHWSEVALTDQIRRGKDCLEHILGAAVTCSASAGWRTDQRVLNVKEAFAFRYNSDCRGIGVFRPRLTDGRNGTPQIPVELPTFDEVAGPTMPPLIFNDFILNKIQAGKTPVYTIHAEVEGISHAGTFTDFLEKARARNIAFVPLNTLLPNDLSTLPQGSIEKGHVPGREGWLGVKAQCPG